MNLGKVPLYAVVLLFQVVQICILLLGYGIFNSIIISKESIIYILSLLNILMFIWQLYSWKILTNSLFHPYILFLGASFLFNSGQSLLVVSDLIEHGYLSGRYSHDLVLSALFFIVVCTNFLHLGALLSLKSSYRKYKMLPKELAKTDYSSEILIVGLILLAVSLPFSLKNIIGSMSIAFSSGYMGLYQGSQATGIGGISNVLADFLMPAAIFILIGGKKRKSYRRISLIIILGYSLSQFLLGYRSAAIMPLVSYLWVWDRSISRISRLFLVIFSLVMMFVIFPLVGNLRLLTGESRLSFTQIFLSIENPVISIIKEMGGSMSTVVDTINLVPMVRDFDYGIGYLYGLLTLLPNLFWDIHPSIAHGTYAHWLIWEIEPLLAAMGGGRGYSYIAEVYINFGVAGPLFIAMFGYFLVKISNWADWSNDAAKIAFVGCALSFFLFIVRAESASVIRPIIWYSLLPYLGIFIIRDVIKNKVIIKRKDIKII